MGTSDKMNFSDRSRRTWIVAMIPLLAVMLIVILLFAVRSSGANQAASMPTPAPVSVETTSPTAAPPSVGQPAAVSSEGVAAIVATPAPSMPLTRSTPENVTAEVAEKIVAIVDDSPITQVDFAEAVAIDAVMAGLAGQSPTNAATLLEQLINTQVVLARSGRLAPEQDVVAALEQFLARHAHSYDDLVVALATNGIPQARFDRYFARLVSADAYLRAQQAATGETAADLLHRWQQAAHISFGPIANSIFGVAQTQVSVALTTPAAVVRAEPAEEPTAEPATTEQPDSEPIVDLPAIDPNEPRGVEVGQLAPEFTLPQLTEGFELKTLRNFWGAPSVLSFWTTWCPYCLRQTPVLVEAHRQWRERGIQFVGINVKEDSSVVEPYVQQHEIEYPVLLDANGVTAAAYAVQGYPTTYFLDGDNRIVARHVGALTEEQLNNYLQMLLPSG